MTHTDDALTEAVAKALYEFWCSESRHHMTHEDMTEGWGYHRKWVEDNDWEPTPKVYGMAVEAIAAVRTHDEQSALNCGHCTPNADEIACACQIEERDDE